MLEVTCELLSHYMRVQGWKEDGRGDMSAEKHRWTTLWWGRETSVADGLVLESNRSGDTRVMIAFRLGLCAAAESLLSEGRLTEALNIPPDTILTALAAEDKAQANRMLSLANIDPAAWESARKR